MEKVTPFSFPGIENIITPSKVMTAVAATWGVSYEAILEDNRTRKVVEPRQVCMYMMNSFLNITTVSIGQILTTQSGRSFGHATVIHAVKIVKIRRETEKAYNKRCEYVELILEGKVALNDFMELDRKKEDLDKLMVAITQGRKFIDELLDDPNDVFIDNIEMFKGELMDLGYHIAKRVAAIRQKLWISHDSEKMNRLG